MWKRACWKVFLLTVEGRESCFFEEANARWGDQMEQTRFTRPLCGGKLRVVEGRYGKFWGCGNYRATGCKFTRKISSRPEAG